ncbi:MAG: 16S rRNA (cytosine(1402)-N(4))-methyltransferase RsmH [Candidatus Pacebacteria bacterium]|nr:16S rRNA (cytosine(1402)-N(4))-methyltransferase RsmH [Candidatus Paceibacterota bacterium]
MIHQPVLLNEVLKYLDPKPNENFIDATIDGGGHTTAILKKNGPDGKVLGIEIDPEIYQKLKKNIEKSKSKNQIFKRLILVNDSYVNVGKIAKKYKFKNIKGILFDLGMSSWHLEESGRGFSFQRDEILDMRYNIAENKNLTAVQILNTFSENELADIFWQYGQEKYSQKIAKNIIKKRKIKPIITTLDLVEIIKNSVPKSYKYRKIHPATKIFQALRIFINQELDNLKIGLEEGFQVLEKGGRMVVISFHSLEDRIVKNFFKEVKNTGLAAILTKKPITASALEIKENPRSRSACLRVLEKL